MICKYLEMNHAYRICSHIYENLCIKALLIPCVLTLSLYHTEFYKRLFKCYAAKLWNEIPETYVFPPTDFKYKF